MDSPDADPIPRPSVVQVSSAFLEALLTRWRVLLVLVALAWACGAIAKAVQGLLFGFDAGAAFGVFGVDIIPTAFFTAATAHAVLWDWKPTVRECLEIASRAFPMILIVLAIYRIAFMIGLVFLFLPGLAVIFVFTFAPVLVMAQKPSVPQAFLGSWQIIRANVAAMIGSYIVFFLACAGALVVGVVVAGIASAGLSEMASGVVIEAGLTSLLSILHITFAASAYKVLGPAEEA